MTPLRPPYQLKRSALRTFLLPLLPLALILGWLIYVDYRSTEQELRTMLEDNTALLVDSYTRTLRTSQQAFDALQTEMAARLSNSARFLVELDNEGKLTPDTIQGLANSLKLFRIVVFDRNGRREFNSNPVDHAHSPPPDTAPAYLTPILSGRVKQLLPRLMESRYGEESRFAVAMARGKRGGVIVVTLEGDLLDMYRHQLGMGHVLKGIAAQPAVVFVIIQDEEGPISVTPPTASIMAIDGDPFLTRAFHSSVKALRFTTHNDREVLEVASPIDLGTDYRALLRVGVDLGFYHQNLASLARRDAMLGFFFLIGGGLLIGLVNAAQNYRFLRSRYVRQLTMADHITRNMDEALIVTGPDRVVQRLNPKAAEWFSLVPGDPLPADLDITDPGVDLDVPIHRSDYLERQGRTLLLHRQSLPEPDTDTPANLLLMARDVTRQRQLEERLQREERLAALGRLVSAVAHEIRNPLNALSLSIQTLNRRLRNHLDEGTRSVLDVIREEIHRLDHLVDDFLGYARPVLPSSEPVPLADVLDRTRRLFAAELESRNILLVIDCDGTDHGLTVTADEKRLEQVVINLVRNSMDALEHGGRIEISAAGGPRGPEMVIRDSGPGFSREALSRALDPFFTTKSNGTGLGLSLSADIIRRHGWTFHLANDPDGGAEVRIIFAAEVTP